MPRAKLDGLTLHYQQAGQGPDVVLIHGFTSNLAMWSFSNLVAELRDQFRVTSYDLRGHGLSDAPPTGYTSADMADDFARLHEHLGLGPAMLVGHSFGGVVAMHAALRHPEKVAAIVAGDSYFPGLAHLEPQMAEAEIWTSLRNSLVESQVADIGAQVDFERLFAVVSAITPEQAAGITKRLGAPAARWLAHLAQLVHTSAAKDAFLEAGLTADEIRRVKQPVVALYDEFTPFQATCDFLAANLRDCRVDKVAGARHLAMLESPEAFVAAVRRHLLALSEGPPSPVTAGNRKG